MRRNVADASVGGAASGRACPCRRGRGRGNSDVLSVKDTVRKVTGILVGGDRNLHAGYSEFTTRDEEHFGEEDESV